MSKFIFVNLIKVINKYSNTYKFIFIKFIRNIIFFKRISKGKKFSKSIILSSNQKSILKKLDIKGYSLLPNQFFCADEINALYSYTHNIIQEKCKNIYDILDYKNIRAINRGVIYQSDHIMYKLMTNKKIIEIVSKYLGMHPCFRRADIVLSRNIIGSLRGSQLWHIDKLDSKIIKLFIYLTDVITDDYGPFILSEKDSKSSKLFIKKASTLGHIHDKKLEKLKINLDPVSIIGPKGTAFLVDTEQTPHKGSIKLKDDRIVFVATYSTHSHWRKMESNLNFKY